MTIFGGVSIKNRVMTVVKQKIKAAQDAYNTEVKALAQAHMSEIEATLAKHEQAKIDLADKHVSTVLSTITN